MERMKKREERKLSTMLFHRKVATVVLCSWLL